MLAWFFAALKGIAVFGRLGWLFSWLPASLSFLGPVGSILGAMLGFIGEIIKWAFEGLTIIISKPVTLVTVALLATVAWGFGLDFGLRWDEGRVNAARHEVAAIKDNLKKQEAKDAQLAAAAKAAREKAVRETTAAPAAQPAAAAAADPAPAAVQRVQPKRAAAAKRAGEGVLWSFPSNFK